MSDSDSYSVDIAALTNHARTVSDLAAQLRAVFDDTGQTTIDTNTYGQTLQSVAGTIIQFNNDIRATVQAGGDGLDSTSAKLSGNADAYEQQETATANSFAALTNPTSGTDSSTTTNTSTDTGGQQRPNGPAADGVPTS